MAEENKSENPRQKCPNPKCGKVYRYDVDFQEHLNVGCKVKSAKKKAKTFSDKDSDSDSMEGLVDNLQIT